MIILDKLYKGVEQLAQRVGQPSTCGLLHTDNAATQANLVSVRIGDVLQMYLMFVFEIYALLLTIDIQWQCKQLATVVGAVGEASSAMDRVMHVCTCGISSANLSQDTGMPVVSRASSLSSIIATFRCFICNNTYRIYLSTSRRTTSETIDSHTPASDWNRCRVCTADSDDLVW